MNLYFIRVQVTTKGLSKIVKMREVEKTTELQYHLVKEKDDFRKVVLKKNLGKIDSGLFSNNDTRIGFESFCLQEDKDRLLADCLAKVKDCLVKRKENINCLLTVLNNDVT